jgi:hypothetical protein
MCECCAYHDKLEGHNMSYNDGKVQQNIEYFLFLKTVYCSYCPVGPDLKKYVYLLADQDFAYQHLVWQDIMGRTKREL